MIRSCLLILYHITGRTPDLHYSVYLATIWSQDYWQCPFELWESSEESFDEILQVWCKAPLHLRLPQSRSVTNGKLCITGSKVIHHKGHRIDALSQEQLRSVGWLVGPSVGCFLDRFFQLLLWGSYPEKINISDFTYWGKNSWWIFVKSLLGLNRIIFYWVNK